MIGVDLGDRWSCYCVLDEAGEIVLEQKVATTPEAMKRELGFLRCNSLVLSLQPVCLARWSRRG